MMTKTRMTLIAWPVLVGLAIALLLISPDVGQVDAGPAAPAVRFEPSNGTLSAGETLVVKIRLEDVTALYGADVRIRFNPALVQVVDADAAAPGVQIQPLSSFLKPDFILRKKACNVVVPDDPDCKEAGFIWYAATQVNPSQPVSGSGDIAAITFRGVAGGTSPLTISYTKLSDREGTEMTATWQHGSITVTGAPPPLTSTPTATATATATVTPTPTATVTPDPNTGTVQGYAYLDYNFDGVRNAGEPGIAGLVISVVPAGGPNQVRRGVTGRDGSYRITGLALDTDYTVRETLYGGCKLTTPESVVVRFPSAGQRLAEVSFGHTGYCYRLTLPLLLKGR